MEKLPKLQEFKAPEGYFEALPDRILHKSKRDRSSIFIRYAAAASILITLGVWQFGLFNAPIATLTLEEEALLYIESNQWSSEDVLGLSENPNEILDQIIEEQFGPADLPLEVEDENWY
jgi:hypothetical protein